MAEEVIYFVSDTHLGDGTGADRFLYPTQLRDLLLRVIAEPRAQLVLLGDIMELWAASLEPVLVRHAPILGLIGQVAAKHPVTYVVGNHDCLPWYYFMGQQAGNIRIAERYTAARGALVALHGHQYDPYNQVTLSEGHVKAPWTRKLVQIMGFVSRVGGEQTGDALAEAALAIEKMAGSLDTTLGTGLKRAHDVIQRESPGERGYPPGERVYEEAALALMRGGVRQVVMGHTHHPLLHQYGNRTYVNTGSWVWDKYPPTYARFSRGALELLDANTHQPFRPAAPT